MPFIAQSKTNWKFLLIVVILAAIVGGGVLWCASKQEVLLTEFPEIKIPEGETADWKTYRNEQYSYEIKYPKDWEVDFSGSYFSDAFYISLSGEISAESFTDFGIEVYEGDYGSQGPMFVSCTESEESEISGINGIKYYCTVPYWKGTGHEKPPISEITSHVIIGELCADENFIPQDYDLEKYGEPGIYNNYFKFVLDCEGEEWIGELGKNNCNQLFNQILSTFRFIEEDETADWQTYRNEIYGYSFQYPPQAKVIESYAEDFRWSEDFEKYTGKICVIVNYGGADIYITTVENYMNEHIWCPGPGGIGMKISSKLKSESIVIGGETYNIEGAESIFGPEDTLTDHVEGFDFTLEERIMIEYGSTLRLRPDYSFKEYLNKDKPVIHKILSTFRFLE